MHTHCLSNFVLEVSVTKGCHTCSNPFVTLSLSTRLLRQWVRMRMCARFRGNAQEMSQETKGTGGCRGTSGGVVRTGGWVDGGGGGGGKGGGWRVEGT